MAKDFQNKSPQYVDVGIGDYIPDQSGLVTAADTEQTHTLQNDCFQVEIKNKSFWETVAYSGRVRISLLSGGTADSGGGGNSGKYILLDSGESVVLDVIEKTVFYYRNDVAGVNIALDVRERIV